MRSNDEANLSPLQKIFMGVLNIGADSVISQSLHGYTFRSSGTAVSISEINLTVSTEEKVKQYFDRLKGIRDNDRLEEILVESILLPSFHKNQDAEAICRIAWPVLTGKPLPLYKI